MGEERINLEQEDNRHDKKPMCPYMQQNPNMMGMYQQQMKQPMMGQMSNPNGRNEYEDDFDEDNYGRRHRRNRYIWNPFLWMWVLRP